MALPTLSLPTFETKIPSTGQSIEYRPFLVKEEKILLMALEGKDKKEISIAINKILEACVYDEIDFSKLPTFDIEYLFLMLRSKSVGEVISFRLGHTGDTECKHKTDIEINLNDVNVEGEIQDGTIMLDDKVGIKVRYPSIDSLDASSKDSRDILGVIADCIDVVFDEEDIYDDFKRDELIEWLGNLNQSQYKKINDFFGSAPKLSYTAKWKCQECGEEDEMTIEGLYNFFM
jgi:hypothetical protein